MTIALQPDRSLNWESTVKVSSCRLHKPPKLTRAETGFLASQSITTPAIRSSEAENAVNCKGFTRFNRNGTNMNIVTLKFARHSHNPTETPPEDSNTSDVAIALRSLCFNALVDQEQYSAKRFWPQFARASEVIG